MYSYSLKCILSALLVPALSEGLLAQAGPQVSQAEPPDDGIIVRWSRRDPFTVYAGNINWTVAIETRMRNSFRVTGKPGPNTIVVRDADGRPVPPSPAQPVYTLKSGNVHSDFFNGSLNAFTLDELGFYLAPGKYSIEVIHRNDQDPPEGSTHGSPPFKGELASPRFQFAALAHPDPGWGKPVSNLVLTISVKSTNVAIGDAITLQGTIRNTGTEPRTLPDTHWTYLARAHLDDPKGGRFHESKQAEKAGTAWTPVPRILGPGDTHIFTYSTERFTFRNKSIGRKGEEMGLYLEIPGPQTGDGEQVTLYSDKIPIRIHGPSKR